MFTLQRRSILKGHIFFFLIPIIIYIGSDIFPCSKSNKARLRKIDNVLRDHFGHKLRFDSDSSDSDSESGESTGDDEDDISDDDEDDGEDDRMVRLLAKCSVDDEDDDEDDHMIKAVSLQLTFSIALLMMTVKMTVG